MNASTLRIADLYEASPKAIRVIESNWKAYGPRRKNDTHTVQLSVKVSELSWSESHRHLRVNVSLGLDVYGNATPERSAEADKVSDGPEVGEKRFHSEVGVRVTYEVTPTPTEIPDDEDEVQDAVVRLAYPYLVASQNANFAAGRFPVPPLPMDTDDFLNMVGDPETIAEQGKD